MNRSERRRSGNTGKVKTYVMTDAQLEKVKAEAMAEGFLMSLSIPVLVLHDKFGFGEDRLNRFLGPCITWMQCVQDGDGSLQEIIKTSQKLANYKFTKRGEGT